MSLHYNTENIYSRDPQIKEYIKILRDWFEKQPHLPQIPDYLAILFLHSCYYSLEQAKKTVDLFFTTRTLCPELFIFPGIDQIKNSALSTFYGVLPEKTPEKYIVYWGIINDPNSDRFVFNQQLMYYDSSMNLHHLAEGPEDGYIAVFDAVCLKFGHLVKFTPLTLKKYIYYIQEAAPVRIKQIHIINANPIAEKLISIAKAFIKADIFQLIHLHKNIEGLFKFVPQRILPQEYGGEAPSIHDLQKQNLKDMEKYSDQFYYLNTLTVDESKRPGKPKTAGDLFGVDGTFKKLELD